MEVAVEVMIINDHDVDTLKIFWRREKYQEMDVPDAAEGRRLTPRPPADEEARREANTIK